MSELTHLDRDGNARMVDVSDKAISARSATAVGRIHLGPAAVEAVAQRTVKKGDVLAIAQLAGIQAAKRTADLVPLCHPLPLAGVKVQLELDEAARCVRCTATVKTTWRTGVEMEALTSVSAALLTVYDMLKAIDKEMVLGGIQLIEKTGGRSGDVQRAPTW